MLFLKVQMEKIHPTLYTSVAPRAEGIEISSFSFILTDFRYTITQGYRAFSVSAQGLTPVLSSLLVYFLVSVVELEIPSISSEYVNSPVGFFEEMVYEGS